MKHAKREAFVVDLMDPPLLLITSILAATLWMAVPFTHRQPVTPTLTAGTDRETLRQEIQRATARRQELQQEAEKLNRALAGHQRPAAGAERSAKTAEAERLARELAQKEDLIARLRRELEEADTPHVGRVVGAPVAVGTQKEKVGFELVNNRVVEITKDNYSVEQLRGSDGQPVIVLSRTGTGEPFTEVEQASSRFLSRLNELRPEQDVLVFLVHSDSFTAFRKVREIARQRGFQVGWEPFIRTDGKILMGAGGREPRVQ